MTSDGSQEINTDVVLLTKLTNLIQFSQLMFLVQDPVQDLTLHFVVLSL